MRDDYSTDFLLKWFRWGYWVWYYFYMTIANQTISIPLSASLWKRVQLLASGTHRSIEDVLITTIDDGVPSAQDVADNVEQELRAMQFLSNSVLVAIANVRIDEENERMEALGFVADERVLTIEEEEEVDILLDLYHSTVLRRAKALLLLKQRGYDVNGLLHSH